MYSSQSLFKSGGLLIEALLMEGPQMSEYDRRLLGQQRDYFARKLGEVEGLIAAMTGPGNAQQQQQQAAVVEMR